MKILLFGKNGQVGWELHRSLQPLGEVIAFGREEADFSRPESLGKIVRDINPDVIVNAVAYTAVDRAESEEDLSETINSVAPGVLAGEAQKLNALLVHYSTDYVFDGANSSPYLESDEPAPVNVYGRTKLDGEIAIQSSSCDFLIFRTSWVYASRGHNFLLTMLGLFKERDELSVVADQTGSPTSARFIADATVLCLKQAQRARKASSFSSGLYHLTPSGSTSWHGFAVEIFGAVDGKSGIKSKVKKIKPLSTSEYPTPAKRPMNSRLNTLKIQRDYGCNMPDWKQMLLLCLDDVLD